MNHIKTISNIVLALVIVAVLVMVGLTLQTVRATGVLRLTTDDASAILAISGTDQGSEYIGQGDANVRLKPGTYDVSATDQGTTVTTSVTIAKQQKVTKYFEVNSQIKKAQKYNSLIAQLPQVGPAAIYQISYYMAYHNGQSSPVITVASSGSEGTEQAQAWLEGTGFSLSDLQIQYTTQQLLPADGNEFVGSTQP
jgi:hypothetical protein